MFDPVPADNVLLIDPALQRPMSVLVCEQRTFPFGSSTPKQAAPIRIHSALASTEELMDFIRPHSLYGSYTHGAQSTSSRGREALVLAVVMSNVEMKCGGNSMYSKRE